MGASMKQPSTDWHERIAPDEAQHLARVVKVIGALQRAKSAKFGRGRALHRKALLAATGRLEVLADLPDHARHGLFATPGRHRVLVRLSNGGPDIQATRLPDIRGFAVKVFDVAGGRRAGRYGRPSGLPDDQPGPHADARQSGIHRLHRSGDPRPAFGDPASLQGAWPIRRPRPPARHVRHDGQEIQRLRRRTIQYRAAALLRSLCGTRAPEANGSSAACRAFQGHRRGHTRAAGDRASHLGPRAAVLRRRSHHADRRRIKSLARRRDAGLPPTARWAR